MYEVSDDVSVFIASLKTRETKRNLGDLIKRILTNYPEIPSGLKGRPITVAEYHDTRDEQGIDSIYFEIALPKNPEHLVQIEEHRKIPIELRDAFQTYSVVILPRRKLCFFTKEGFNSPDIGLFRIIAILNSYRDIEDYPHFDGKLYSRVKTFKAKLHDFKYIKKFRIIFHTIPNPTNDEVSEWFHDLGESLNGTKPTLEISGAERNAGLNIFDPSFMEFFQNTVEKQQAEAEVEGVLHSAGRDKIKTNDYQRSERIPKELVLNKESFVKHCMQLRKQIDDEEAED